MKKLTLHTSFKDLKKSNVKKDSPTGIHIENQEYKDFLLLLRKNSIRKSVAIRKKPNSNE